MSAIPGVSLTGGARVLIAAKPVDFRKGANGLAALAKEVLAQDPFSGTIIVFRAKRADRVKILLWDGSGLMLVWKRLEQGGFKWPPIMDGVMQLSPAQLAALIEGLDWRRVHVREVVRPIACNRCGKVNQGAEFTRHTRANQIRCMA